MKHFTLFITLFCIHAAWASELETEPVVVEGHRVRHDTGRLRLATENADEKNDLQQILTQVPNLSSDSGSNRPRFFQIRGVGETSQFEHSQVNAVGVFYEGIDLSEEASTVPLLGRETLFITYGPQSTDWGGKALAGIMAVNSCLDRPCSHQFWQGTIGNFNTYGLAGGAAWKGERVSAIVNAGVSTSDGYIHNDYLNRWTASRDEKEIVAGIAYPLGSVRVREHHLLTQHRNGYDNWSFEPSFTTLSDHPGWDRHFVQGHSVEWEVPADGARVWGLTSYTLTHQEEAYDEDWANNIYWNQIPGWNQDYNYFSEFERRREKFHQKLGWVSPAGLDIGLHYYYYDEDQVIRSFKDEALRSENQPGFQSHNLGLWTKKTWAWDQWSVAGGARVEHQDVRLDGYGASHTRDVAPQWSSDIRIQHKKNEMEVNELLLQRGFRGGGYNTSPGLTDDRIEFGPEQIYLAQLSHQTGDADSNFVGRLFHQWQVNQQERSSYQADLMDPNTFTYFTSNIDGSRSYGAEALYMRRWGLWQGSGSAGWLHSAYNSYSVGGRDLGGRALAQAPPWTYHVRLEYLPRNWSAYIQLAGKDGYYHSVDHDFKSSPYHLVDMGASHRFGKWQIRAWVKNVLDKRYVVRAFYFANEPPDWLNKYYTQLGPPRTYALQLEYEY